MKRVVMLALAVLAVSTSAFAAGGKIGYVDTQTVFDKTKLGQKYQGILRDYYDSRKKILDMDADDIQKMRDDYAKQSSMLKPDARKDREDAISKKISDFEKKRNEFNNELSKKNEELSQDFNQELMTVLKDMAKKEKYSLILNKSINMLSKGEVPSVLYADDELDLTTQVMSVMDKKFDSQK